MSRTLDSYDANGAEFARRYERVDQSAVLDRSAVFFLGTRRTPRESQSGGGLRRADFDGRPLRVLELGCGSGRDGAWFTRRGFVWSGVDGSATMLAEAARYHPELADRIYHVVLPAPLPFPAGSFDAVMSSATLMHLGRDSLPLVFPEVRRVLVPGGRMVVSVSSCRPGLDEEGYDQSRRLFTLLPQERWGQMIREAGFAVLEQSLQADAAGRPGVGWLTLFCEREAG